MDVRTRDGNLDAEAQNAFLRRGVTIFAISLALSVLLVRTNVAMPFRFLLFIPFVFASYGIHLGLFKTCGIMAARGVRSMDGSVDRICDKTERCALRRQGIKVLASSFFAAALATALLAFLP